MEKNKEAKKTYSYKSRKDKIRLRIVDDTDVQKGHPKNSKLLDGMDSICASKGSEAMKRAEYYNQFDYKSTDPEGMYTGVPTKTFGEVPVQDVDDL